MQIEVVIPHLVFGDGQLLGTNALFLADSGRQALTAEMQIPA